MENSKKLKDEREKYARWKGRIESVGNSDPKEMGAMAYNWNYSDAFRENKKDENNKNINNLLDDSSDSEEEKPKKTCKKKTQKKNKDEKNKNLCLSIESEGSSEEEENKKGHNKENINTANFDKNLIDVSSSNNKKNQNGLVKDFSK